MTEHHVLYSSSDNKLGMNILVSRRTRHERVDVSKPQTMNAVTQEELN